jgi:hypothetical protein
VIVLIPDNVLKTDEPRSRGIIISSTSVVDVGEKVAMIGPVNPPSLTLTPIVPSLMFELTFVTSLVSKISPGFGLSTVLILPIVPTLIFELTFVTMIGPVNPPSLALTRWIEHERTL